MEKTIDIQDLTIAFQSKQQVLTAVDQINFYINPGETLALLGESGCGKSLTSLALMRLLPPQGVYGQQSQIHCFDEDMLNLSEHQMQDWRGRRIAIIFQEPMTALNPVLTIEQQLSEAITQHQTLKHGEIRAQLLQLLKEVDISNPEQRLKQYPHQLSGGQKQRIVIAMALASHPEILIADEPTTALDVTIQAQILLLLKRIQQRHKMSLLLITHDLGVVKTMANRVCVMYAGQIVETALVEDFFKQPLHPYSQQLLLAQPSITKRNQQLQSISGSVPTLESLPSGCRFHPRCAHVFAPCSEVVPRLQNIEINRQVRCLLYPELAKPPEIPIEEKFWVEALSVSDPILSVNHLVVNFPLKKSGLFHVQKQFHAVKNVSFNLYPRRTLALVGESGCGKTTTARAIVNLQAIQGGEIIYRGQSVSRMRGNALKQFRKKVQIIFQDPFSSMNPRMTIDEILSEGMAGLKLSQNAQRNKKLQLLDQVNLPKNSLLRYPHQFSGGQRQRICIARALATEPEILICDEPTSALDVSVQAQILNLLKTLQQEHGLAYLFITHNMGVVGYIADEVLVMKAGEVIEQGECETLFHSPQKAYTQQLLKSVLTIE